MRRPAYRDVIFKLLAFTAAMIIAPIGMYFLTVESIFKGESSCNILPLCIGNLDQAAQPMLGSRRRSLPMSSCLRISLLHGGMTRGKESHRRRERRRRRSELDGVYLSMDSMDWFRRYGLHSTACSMSTGYYRICIGTYFHS